jgi:hypothetical protein
MGSLQACHIPTADGGPCACLCNNSGRPEPEPGQYSSYRYCPANSNRGLYYAKIIRAGKLEARLFLFSNFKGTPSQEEHKINFRGLKISKMALSELSDATALFSAVRYTLCDTYIEFPQSANSGKSI